MRALFFLLFLIVSSLLLAQVPRLVVPIGHTELVNSVAFSPDGQYVLTGSLDNTAKLWDLSGRVIQTFTGHTAGLYQVAFSPDGKTILTGSEDKTAKLWDLSGRVIQTFTGHTSVVLSVAFSPNGKTILTGSGDKTAKLWDLSGREIQAFMGHAAFVSSVAFSPDGKTILTGSGDKTAKLWGLSGREIQTFMGHTSDVYSVAFSPDGKMALTGSKDNTAKLWNLSGQEIQTFTGHAYSAHSLATPPVSSVAFSPDGKAILTGSGDKTAKLWDIKTGRVIQTFTGHAAYVYSVAFSPDGEMVLTGSLDKKTKLWDVKTGRVIQTFTGHAAAVLSVAFSPDGMTVLIGREDKTAKLWELSGRVIQTFTGHTLEVSSVAFSPDSKTVFTGSKDKTAKLWDLSGRVIQTFTGHAAAVLSGAFSPDGKTVLTGSGDKTAKLWDLSGRVIQTFTGHAAAVLSVAFSPDGKMVLTGSRDNTAKLWDLSGHEIQTFMGHASSVRSVAFSPDSKTFLTGSFDSTVELWDLSGREIQTFMGHAGSFNSLAFSLDGKRVLTGSSDHTAKLWDLSGRVIQTFTGHAGQVFSVAFSSDGKKILTGNEDNTTKLWSLTTGQELATLIDIDSTDWIITTPSGLFDASPGAMKLMYYVVGLDVIDLEQLKDRYYEPGLLSKIMGFTPGGLRPVDELKNVALHPQITQASITGDRLHVELEARSGGIGKVALLLDDNIELDTNANPGFQATFDVDLQRFAGHFYPDSINHLSLRTYNHDGWLKGQPYQLEYRPTPSPTTLLSRREQQLDSINLYALVVGTSHFRGQQLNLQYPDQDATAFAEALRLAGKPLFGKNINVQLLTTAAEPWPRKVVIAKAMRDIAAQADPNDILLVYFSGHGITYPPNSEKGQFYYLTTDIGSDKLDDPAVLAGLAIAQDTLQEWIRQIKARKRILILDACNSGRVVERLEPGAKELNSDQRRALEQMKDRSGMFVLAGSAADKSSFEASRYGHGLLTYSLLNNMPIVATANKHFILVDKLFGLVREEVPRLAKGIGKVQDPELIGGESYAIGLINESVRIVVPEAKPVFVRTVFIDSDKSKDLLHLSTAVNDYLERRATEKDPAIAYWPVEEFNGDHYYLGGQYRQAGETVSGKATLYREDKELASFPFSGDRNGLGGLAEGILGLVFGYLNSHRD